MRFVDKHIEIETPKSTRKLTGTRFAAIFGLNAWTTPFNVWCDVTKTYKEPFEDTIYTIAGKTIEPKQADYMEKLYGLEIVRPEDVFGPDPFKSTWGDFFKDEEVLGGMWDYLVRDEEGDVVAVIECKTSKRSEDWEDDIPEYYALQAALYCHLLKKKHPRCNMVIMVATFLQDGDYAHPEDFVVSADNTIVRPFKLEDRYPDFDRMVCDAYNWWEAHVTGGVSPDFDEKKDADILKELRKTHVDTNDGFDELILEAERLKAEIDEVSAQIKDKEKRYKKLTDYIKSELMKPLEADDGLKQSEVVANRYIFSVSRSMSESVNKDAMKEDGVFDKYVTTKPSYRINVKEKK